jgi:formylglycine-generating enzyme required for sulfatase activity/serine/threonine protein kinase
MELHALQPGYLLAEYRIEKLMGEGGFGLTYLAFDTHLEKQVAIKEYMPSDFAIRQNSTTIVPKSEAAKTDYEWGLQAFINEAKTLARFDDPNIVRIYRFFKENGTAYLVMEYCEGGCLSERFSKKKPMGEAKVLALITPIMNGLQLVHDDQVFHRDIKPDNIMFRLNGTPVLIDFGAARQIVGMKSRSITTIVTPGYAPIEQYSKKGKIGPWTDIYSLAAVAYTCLTGSAPEDATDRIVDDDIKPLANGPSASGFLHAIDKALSVKSSMRPQDLSEWYAMWGEESTTGEDYSQLDDMIDLLAVDGVITDKQMQTLTNKVIKLGLDKQKAQSYITQVADKHGWQITGWQQPEPTPEPEVIITPVEAPPIHKPAPDKPEDNKHKWGGIFWIISTLFLLISGVGFYSYQQYEAPQIAAQLDKAEQEIAAKAKAEQERVAKAKAEQERVAKAKAEQERVVKAKAEQERVAKAKAQQERVAKAKAEQERVAKAKAEQERVAKAKAEQEIAAEKQQAIISQAVGVMVAIPSGRFQMGSDDGGSDEKPIHEVSIKAFNMGQTEVTFAQWDTCVNAGGCSHKPDDGGWGRGTRPVMNVSYNDITKQFIPWLNKETGNTYRLPSEAEWEYAARAGSTTKYSWGDTASHENANYGKDACCNGLAKGKDRWEYTSPVKSFSANAFGLYDMHGNVWEWTQDCWNESYQGAPKNGQSWVSGVSGECSRRVLRGGSWIDAPRVLRVSYRFRFTTAGRNSNIGFRLAQDR